VGGRNGRLDATLRLYRSHRDVRVRFGSFAEKLLELQTLTGLPFRPLASVLADGLFVGLNVLGARATGTSEEILVALKVVILFGISAWGLWYGFQQSQLSFGFDRLASTSFVTAIAVSFVSFQGWQLLMYDQDSIEDPKSTLPKAVFVSIVGAIVIDSMVAILVTSLVKTNVIANKPEVAVALAVEPFLG
jgi:amino acid transporter